MMGENLCICVSLVFNCTNSWTLTEGIWVYVVVMWTRLGCAFDDKYTHWLIAELNIHKTAWLPSILMWMVFFLFVLGNWGKGRNSIREFQWELNPAKLSHWIGFNFEFEIKSNAFPTISVYISFYCIFDFSCILFFISFFFLSLFLKYNNSHVI